MGRGRGRRTGLGSHVKGRQRLLAGAATILIAYPLLAAAGWSAAIASSLAWDAGILVYLILSGLMMFGSTPDRITRRARELDISLGEIVIITVLAAGFSLFAAARVLAQAKVESGELETLYLSVGAISIVLSWFLVHTLFAIHYAHEFYNEGDGGKNAGGLDFPGGHAPDYWDFIYFAAVVAMTCQVSDVTIHEREMRHLVTAHGIVSFFLNTVILALSVGIAASLI